MISIVNIPPVLDDFERLILSRKIYKCETLRGRICMHLLYILENKIGREKQSNLWNSITWFIIQIDWVLPPSPLCSASSFYQSLYVCRCTSRQKKKKKMVKLNLYIRVGHRGMTLEPTGACSRVHGIPEFGTCPPTHSDPCQNCQHSYIFLHKHILEIYALFCSEHAIYKRYDHCQEIKGGGRVKVVKAPT